MALCPSAAGLPQRSANAVGQGRLSTVARSSCGRASRSALRNTSEVRAGGCSCSARPQAPALRQSTQSHASRSAPPRATAQAAAPAAPKMVANVPRGETAGAALLLEGVCIQAGDRDLLSNAEWRLQPGSRVGLVGANGAGKSTLLKCLCGERKVDSGHLVIGPQVELGFLPQIGVSGSTLTVWEEARSQMSDLLEAEAALESAVKALEAGEAMAAERLNDAQTLYALAGGYDADKRIANVLTGLGFKQADWTRASSMYSGGWQMRIALARLLLSPAGQSATGGGADGMLLLDEPTNHLDRKATVWLADFLASSSGSCVIVSHDEELLQKACDRIVEVRGGTLHHYTGSYSSFMEQRSQREDQARALALGQQEEIARLEDFVRRFGANASKASQAQSRAKVLEKLRENAVEIPAASSGAGPGDKSKASLRFLPPPPCHREIIVLKDGAVGWGGEALITGINLVVEKGHRLLILGPNGAGKSTLLKSIAGEIPLHSGSYSLGEGARMAVFSQDLAQDLPLEEPALEYVLAKAREQDPSITNQQGLRSLGALGLAGAMANRQIGQLSGGEKARVALAAFSLIPYNCLLLDEASNHLDAATIDVLSGALKSFEGSIVAITHNSAFATSLEATHVLRVKDGTAVLSANFGLSSADFDHGEKASSKQVAGTGPRRTPKKTRAPSVEEELEAQRAAARAERFEAGGNDMAEADAKPKSKRERMEMQRRAEEKEKAEKAAVKARGSRR